jgi:hypothetical protein
MFLFPCLPSLAYLHGIYNFSKLLKLPEAIQNVFVPLFLQSKICTRRNVTWLCKSLLCSKSTKKTYIPAPIISSTFCHSLHFKPILTKAAYLASYMPQNLCIFTDFNAAQTCSNSTMLGKIEY